MTRRARAAVLAAVLAAVTAPFAISAAVSGTRTAVVRPSQTAADVPACILWDDDAGTYVFTVGACTL